MYRAGYEESLCKREKRLSKANRILSQVVETAIGSVVSGGVSNLQKFSKSIQMVRELNIKAECIGLSLMKLIAQNGEAKELFQRYYDFQVETGLFTGLTRLTTKNSNAQESYVFSQLDGLLMGGNGSSQINETDRGSTPEGLISLKGPSYFTARQSRSSSQLLINSDLQEDFCSLVGTGRTSPRNNVQTRSRAIN